MVVVLLKIDSYHSEKEETSVLFIGERILVNEKIKYYIEEMLEFFLGKQDIEKMLNEYNTRIRDISLERIDNGYILKKYSTSVIKEKGWVYSSEKEIETEHITKFLMVSYVKNDEFSIKNEEKRSYSNENIDVKKRLFLSVIEELKNNRPILKHVVK